MIALEQIKNFFPAELREMPTRQKYMLKEYIQLMILDFLSTSVYLKKITFIGGTNLRLVKGIDRFSEDIDFDCKEFPKSEFIDMTDSIVEFLKRSGLRVETREKNNDKLKAFRRNIYFPEFLFELGLSGYRDERFLIKIECQDQKIIYPQKFINIKGCGFFFPFPVPTDEVLCAMKISALLSRHKGRDFYDVMFLLAQTKPDYEYLSVKCNIHNLKELKTALNKLLEGVNPEQKSKDLEHLLFQIKNSKRILAFGDFIDEL